jgi:hypothetical protein
MVGNPAEPPEPRQRSDIDPQTHAHEHSGPMAIERHVKDDGRALILYTRDEPPPA